MRGIFFGMGAVVMSCGVMGCGDGGGESLVPPNSENRPEIGQEALKKMQMNAMPTAKGGMKSTPAVPKLGG
jgi:hypothetical protein